MTLTQPSLFRPIRPLLLCLCAIAALAGLSGCGLFGSGGTKIRLEPTGRYIIYDQQFAAAWCKVNTDGELDMVLVNQPQPAADDQGQALFPSVGGSPMQVMHIHVAWQPNSGMKPNYPAATNASINWYVIDNHDPHNPQYIHYQGTGLVRIDVDDNAIGFDIQPTLISLRHQKGALRDPIGPSLLSGNIKAQVKPQKIADVLSGLEDIFREAPDNVVQAPATEPSGTPSARGQAVP